MTREESRRIAFYREVSKLGQWEETLKVLEEWNRSNVVTAMNSVGNGVVYWTGRADAINDFILRVKNSTKVKINLPKGEEYDKKEEIA